MTTITNVEGFRIRMIQMGLEAEMRGFRLTAKAPRCFKIIEMEFGIKTVKRNKRKAYEDFCAMFGLTAKPAPAPTSPTP